MPRRSFRLLRGFGLAALFLAAALFGIAGGVLFVFTGDLPQISALDHYSPGTTTRVLGRDGSVIGEFATERRDLVTYAQIPPVLRNAIISAEDGDFFNHGGLNLKRIVVTAVRRALFLRRNGGASTLTQQLARKLFLTDERTLERKIKEAILAVQIEKRYTKPEIFAMYCNQMYWGHGAYGVEAASELYFSKHVSDLNLDEAAMIAGIIQGNDRQSPYRDMSAALARRAYTLDRMAANGYISKADAAAARRRPIVVRGQPAPPRSIAPYYLETIRIRLEDKYGKEALWQGGLTIKTGLDPVLQQVATRSLDAQLRVLDKARGYRKPAHNLLAEGKTVESYKNARWSRAFAVDDVVPAVVLGIDKGAIALSAGKWTGSIDRTGYAWTNRKAELLVKRGDLVDVQLKKIDAKASTFAASLDQTPELEGAVIALDNRTGDIMTMIGGRNFERSQFNRATQALRQVGSLFKPFVYTAAIDSGAYTEESVLHDEPTSFFAGPNQPPYEPKNYDRQFAGDIPLHLALEESRNVPTVALMEQLDPHKVVPYAQRMGLTSPIPPYLSTAIGSAEASLVEMTSAYTAWPNQGVRMSPVLMHDVTDRQGNVLETSHPEPHDVLRADTAYVVTTMLHGVVMNGTAKAGTASFSSDWPLGGKTGTTDDYTDAWFIGFDPDITIGVWVGFDTKKQIGADATGAVAALPVWVDIMKAWIAERKAASPDAPAFAKPDNVVVIFGPTGPEAFIAGTEPGRESDKRAH
jgi:penicillin-binding protein 1A